MSIAMSLLATLDEAPTYGLHLKNEFEGRTGTIWPLNVGQVYTTLARLERDGLVRVTREDGADGQKIYEVTPAGRERLRAWFATPTQALPPARDELVLKLVMAVVREGVNPEDVIQAERRNAVQALQEYTRLKRETRGDDDLGWTFLLDSLIFQTEARVRWLDMCEARLGRSGLTERRSGPAKGHAHRRDRAPAPDARNEVAT